MRILFVALLLVLFAAPALAGEGVIGTIMEVEGSATLTSEGRPPAPVAVNTEVHLNDVIETGVGARVFVLFIDDTEMTLSENTQLKVDEYVFDTDDATNNKGVYSVLRGAFLYVSGLIAKKDNPDVKINTPVGSIGVRGTEFWGGNIDNEYGVLVNEGRVNVANSAGEVSLEKGQGTSVRDRRSRPAAAKFWGQEKIQRVNAMVFLKRRDILRQRVQKHRARQLEMRSRFKALMEKRRGGLQERPKVLQPENKMRRGEKLREKMQDGNKNMLRRRESR